MAAEISGRSRPEQDALTARSRSIVAKALAHTDFTKQLHRLLARRARGEVPGFMRRKRGLA